MPTTSNFGWTTPADTDLVKDGAAAIRTLGNGIDTSLVDLKGGTTGQVLSKTSNTDLDFTWVADASGIPATIFDAKGDLIAASAADTAARLAVGTDGQFLTADSTASTGLKWSTAATTKNFSLLSTTTTNGAASYTVSSLSGYDILYVTWGSVSANSNSAQVRFQFNADTGSNYRYQGLRFYFSTTYNYNDATALDVTGTYFVNGNLANAAQAHSGWMLIQGCNTAGKKMVSWGGGCGFGGSATTEIQTAGGYYDSASVISSIKIFTDTGSFDGGTLRVFGAA